MEQAAQEFAMTWDVWLCIAIFGVSVIVGMLALKSL